MEIAIANNEAEQFKKILTLQSKRNDCGLKTSIYSINSSYGKGNVVSYYFDGLLINIINAQFKEDILFTGKHNFNTLELSILTQGQKIIRVSELKNDIVLEQNESYLVYANDVQGKLIFYKDNPVKEIKIRMYDEFINKHQLQPILFKEEIAGLKKLNKSFSMQLTSKMEEIATEVLGNTQQGLLKRLFLESKTLELLNQQLNFKHKESDNLLKKVYKVEAIIQSNIHQQITVQQLSRRVLLNENVLKAEFKKIFGSSIFNYSLALRIKKAKLLLANTCKPIYEIADIVGYKNPTHFTAAFKKAEKMTPKAYRKTFN
ncbi:AraC family transcriptional regulator [uncultured Tenacibaculum sp.]|uniref:helix-turn-helix domain-containing protein n=1 Tax=uncultured Tenacibaculum sp. TaxID=174713 RepID=UPI002611BD55|nr:AraC family transcriptional regulator [uncultured Tenacibaculum sp.]